MTGFPQRPIAVVLCCLFSGATGAWAEEGAAPLYSADAQLVSRAPLRLEGRLRLAEAGAPTRRTGAGGVQPAPNDGADLPLFLSADSMEGQASELAVAEGNVELRKDGLQLRADRLSYRPLDDEVDASGNVRLSQDGTEVESAHLRMKLSERLGFAESSRYSVTKTVDSRLYEESRNIVTVTSVSGSNSGAPMMLKVADMYGLPTASPPPREMTGQGTAERIEFVGENHLRLDGGTFSTCKPASQDWYLKAGEIDLDYNENYGSASDTSLWFKGVPLFYAPKAWFPLNSQRRSGLLSPSFKQSTKTGLDFTLPIYWNIAPNYDATFYPRYMSKRGMQLGIETRYLDERLEGEWRGEYLSHDRNEERSRYGYSIQHRQRFTDDLTGSLNWNGVSDDTYWEDMSSRLLQTSQVQLERRAMLNYAPSPWWQGSLQVLRYQTLQPDPDNPVDKPYFLEPQLSLLGYKPDLMGFDFSLLGQYSRFTHNDHASKDRGDRFVLYPQLSRPFIFPAFQMIPKLGLHMSSYSIDRATLNGGGSDSITRVLPTFSLDATMVLERPFELLGNRLLQTLEPRLYYVYIPYRDQSDIPVFDTGLADFNFAQVFSENRYSGYDRINDAHQLTAALTTRVLDATTGAERFKAMVGQRYYFSKQRVILPGETTRPNNFSNLIASVNGLVAPKTYAEATWEYNYDKHVSERFSAGLRYQPDYGKVLSASYRYTRDPLTNESVVDQVDLAGQWPLAPQWYAVGRFNYSMRDHQSLETIAGLEYNAGCWAVRGVVQRLAATSGSPNTSYYLQLELQDFTSLGSNPLSLLRRSIPGYGKTNELPVDGNLISSP